MRRKMAFCLTLVALGVGAARPTVHAADLDPKAISIQLPADIKWVKAANGGSEQAVLAGDPAKPGLYVVLQKWLPHNNSRPHSHPNDRYITVLKGTWWVNTGSNYDPDGMKPVRRQLRDPLRTGDALRRCERRGVHPADRRHGAGQQSAGAEMIRPARRAPV
jgi:hypothetical protein